MFVQNVTKSAKRFVFLLMFILLFAYLPAKVFGGTSPLTPPGNPVLQVAAGTQDTVQVNVAWTASTGDTVTVQGYKLYRSVDGGQATLIATGDSATFTTSGSTVSYVDTLQVNSSKYSYYVQAYDNLNNDSLPSATTSTYISGPTVANSIPQNSATGVSIKPVIQFVFNQEIDPTTVTASNFKIRSSGGTYLAGTIVTYNSASKTANLNIQGTLVTNQTYTLEVTTGVRNISGFNMANAVSSTFTTSNSNNYPHGNYSLTTSECSKCHQSHTAAGPELIVKTSNNADSNELCYVCHNGVQSNDFFGKDNYNNYGHFDTYQPRQASDCNTCHTPHGSSNPELLAGPYDMSANTAKTDYDPVSQFYCTNSTCHTDFSSTNLTASSQTSFRNPVSSGTKIDLHYLHLKSNPNNQGNATCYDCHRPHGSIVSEIEGADTNQALLGVVHMVGFPSTSTVTPTSGNPSPRFVLNPIPDRTGGGCTLTCHGATHVSGTAGNGELDSRYDNAP